MLYFTCFTPEVPPPIPQEHPPPLGGDFTTFLENIPPYTRRKDQYRGKLTPPPGGPPGTPPGGGSDGGG